MRSNFLLFKPEKAVIIAKYHSPGITYEQVRRDTAKCAAIVEIYPGKVAPFTAQVCLNVDPIFGKILWHQISGDSKNFCVHLTSWLFHQWGRMKEKQGKRSIIWRYHLRGRLHGEFQPGLKFQPAHRAEILLRLHG